MNFAEFTVQLQDKNNLPLSYGYIYPCQSGTDIPCFVYTDVDTTPTYAPWPIQLDNTGSATFYLDSARAPYEFNVEDTNGVQQDNWEQNKVLYTENAAEVIPSPPPSLSYCELLVTPSSGTIYFDGNYQDPASTPYTLTVQTIRHGYTIIPNIRLRDYFAYDGLTSTQVLGNGYFGGFYPGQDNPYYPENGTIRGYVSPGSDQLVVTDWGGTWVHPGLTIICPGAPDNVTIIDYGSDFTLSQVIDAGIPEQTIKLCEDTFQVAIYATYLGWSNIESVMASPGGTFVAAEGEGHSSLDVTSNNFVIDNSVGPAPIMTVTIDTPADYTPAYFGVPLHFSGHATTDIFPYDSYQYVWTWGYGQAAWGQSVDITWDSGSTRVEGVALTATSYTTGQSASHIVYINVGAPIPAHWRGLNTGPQYGQPDPLLAGGAYIAATSDLYHLVSTGSWANPFYGVGASATLAAYWYAISTLSLGAGTAGQGTLLSSTDGNTVICFNGYNNFGYITDNAKSYGTVNWVATQNIPPSFGGAGVWYSAQDSQVELHGASQDNTQLCGYCTFPYQVYAAQSFNGGHTFTSSPWVQTEGTAQTMTYICEWWSPGRLPDNFISSNDGTLAFFAVDGMLHKSTLDYDCYGSGLQLFESMGSFPLMFSSWWGLRGSADLPTIIGAKSVSPNYLSVSRDYGATWTDVCTEWGTNHSWSFLHISASGQYIIACSSQDWPSPYGYIYTSSDYGTTWVRETAAGSRHYQQCMISDDGTKKVAVYGGSNTVIYY